MMPGHGGSRKGSGRPSKEVQDARVTSKQRYKQTQCFKTNTLVNAEEIQAREKQQKNRMTVAEKPKLEAAKAKEQAARDARAAVARRRNYPPSEIEPSSRACR